jgi:hypothetical protein
MTPETLQIDPAFIGDIENWSRRPRKPPKSTPTTLEALKNNSVLRKTSKILFSEPEDMKSRFPRAWRPRKSVLAILEASKIGFVDSRDLENQVWGPPRLQNDYMVL